MTTAPALYSSLRERGFRFRIDDDDRLRVSPGAQLTPADRAAIRQHRGELMAMVAIDTDTGDERNDVDEERSPASSRTAHAVPPNCLGPTACAVLGVCGRPTCHADIDPIAGTVARIRALSRRDLGAVRGPVAAAADDPPRMPV